MTLPPVRALGKTRERGKKETGEEREGSRRRRIMMTKRDEAEETSGQKPWRIEGSDRSFHKIVLARPSRAGGNTFLMFPLNFCLALLALRSPIRTWNILLPFLTQKI